MSRFNSSVLTDEGTAWQYLIQARWPDGVFCPACRGTMRLKISRRVFQCTHCAKELSPTSGTLFHKSRLSLAVWFRAMHLLITSVNGISARELQRQLNLRSYRAAWLLAQKIRAAMAAPGEPSLWKASNVPRRFIKGRGAPGRRGIPHGWSSKYHDAYSAESAFRAVSLDDAGRAFDRLLAACLTHPPKTLGEIKA